MNGPAIIFDTETTDKDDEREIIEAAWLRPRSTADLAGQSDAIPRPLLDHIADKFDSHFRRQEQ